MLRLSNVNEQLSSNLICIFRTTGIVSVYPLRKFNTVIINVKKSSRRQDAKMRNILRVKNIGSNFIGLRDKRPQPGLKTAPIELADIHGLGARCLSKQVDC